MKISITKEPEAMMLRRLLVAVTLLFVTITPVVHADSGTLLSARATTVFVGPFPAPV